MGFDRFVVLGSWKRERGVFALLSFLLSALHLLVVHQTNCLQFFIRYSEGANLHFF